MNSDMILGIVSLAVAGIISISAIILSIAAIKSLKLQEFRRLEDKMEKVELHMRSVDGELYNTKEYSQKIVFEVSKMSNDINKSYIKDLEKVLVDKKILDDHELPWRP